MLAAAAAAVFLLVDLAGDVEGTGFMFEKWGVVPKEVLLVPPEGR